MKLSVSFLFVLCCFLSVVVARNEGTTRVFLQNLLTKLATVPHTDVCSQPLIIGTCRARIPLYYFDSKTNSCEKFEYGGCDGNDNQFATLDECKKACM